MTYHCGIGGGMRAIGLEPCDPHIKCDGCGLVRSIPTRGIWAAKWFLDGKAPPGWSGGRRTDHTREDWCQRCTAERKEAADLHSVCETDRVLDMSGDGALVRWWATHRPTVDPGACSLEEIRAARAGLAQGERLNELARDLRALGYQHTAPEAPGFTAAEWTDIARWMRWGLDVTLAVVKSEEPHRNVAGEQEDARALLGRIEDIAKGMEDSCTP